MSSAVSAAEANRTFSSILRGAKEGRSFTITSHGRPVARIVPVEAGNHVMHAGRAALFERLTRARIQVVGPWTRDDLHERDR